MTFELMDTYEQGAVLKVIGVGGGGGNAVGHMVDADVDGVEFICANTDAQALKSIAAKSIIQLGTNMTKGLGAGANPDVGRQAAMEDHDRLEEVIKGADMLFITAGMGGGTGTGAAPVIANIARELGVLTVAVVTRPFSFEGKKRMQIAEKGIDELARCVDSLITIPNEKLLTELGAGVGLLDAFRAANDVLLGAVQGIADLITRPGLINVDFADVRTVMSEMGMAMMGSGSATGPDRAREAAEAAVFSPLLEDVNISGAKGILVNVTAGDDMGLSEYGDVGDTISTYADDDATIVVGTVIDPSLGNELRVTLVATGLQAQVPAAIATTEDEQIVNLDQFKNDVHTQRQRPVRKMGEIVDDAVKSESAEPVAEPQQPKKMANASVAGISQEDLIEIPAFLRKQAD